MARRKHSSLRKHSGPPGHFGVSTWISRLLFLAGFGATIALIGGFVRFADHVSALEPPRQIVKADGVVVLTGGSVERLKAGVTLVEAGRANRLLISGVNKAATREEVRLATGGKPETWVCCVDIGKEALDTVGNAREILEWTARNRMTTIILVTDSYHMPRSLMEVRRAVPSVKIVPYPVRVGVFTEQKWWMSERVSRGLALEYSKYLVANLRAFWLGLTGRSHEGRA